MDHVQITAVIFGKIGCPPGAVSLSRIREGARSRTAPLVLLWARRPFLMTKIKHLGWVFVFCWLLCVCVCACEAVGIDPPPPAVRWQYRSFGVNRRGERSPLRRVRRGRGAAGGAGEDGGGLWAPGSAPRSQAPPAPPTKAAAVSELRLLSEGPGPAPASAERSRTARTEPNRLEGEKRCPVPLRPPQGEGLHPDTVVLCHGCVPCCGCTQKRKGAAL